MSDTLVSSLNAKCRLIIFCNVCKNYTYRLSDLLDSYKRYAKFINIYSKDCFGAWMP